MSEQRLMQLALTIFMVFCAYSIWGTSASEKDNRPHRGGAQKATAAQAGEGLDLRALTEMAKKVANAEELERKLNQPGGVNNLDIDKDGKVDYIKVQEYGDEKVKGFSLTTEPTAGEVQEVATIAIEPQGDRANIEVQGNERVYGHHRTYSDHSMLGTFLLASYLFRPHPFYMSPWGFGHYPGYYSPYSSLGYGGYRSRVNGFGHSYGGSWGRGSGFSSRPRSPNAGRNATNTWRRAMGRSGSQGRGVGNVGSRRRSFGSSASRPSVRRSPFGRSGGLFGGK